MANIQLYNDLINEINKLPSGTEFQINELCTKSKYYKVSDMPSIGKRFKDEVLSGNIPSVVHDILKTDNHNIYKKV